jgi:hypothetical protein
MSDDEAEVLATLVKPAATRELRCPRQNGRRQGGHVEREQLVRHVKAMYTAFATGDADAYRDAFAEDVVWHVPGDNPVSGAYRGSVQYFETMPALMGPLTAGPSPLQTS